MISENRKQKNNLVFSFLGFTLAEVLITLGIIGVVAAMTIPTLINNQQKQATATKLEKAYSVLSQAFLNAQVEMGTSSGWTPPATSWSQADSNTWWNTYFIPYSKLSVATACPSNNGNGATNKTCNIAGIKHLDGATFSSGNSFDGCDYGGCFVLNDGTELNFGSVNSSIAALYVDLNGKAGSNVIGKDIFCLYFHYKEGKLYFDQYWNSRTTLLSDNDSMCNKTASSKTLKGMGCGRLIQMDGWKIADDYPW